MSVTLRGWHDIPLHEWPSREDALAVIAALATGRAATWGQLEQLSGVPGAARFIGLAYRVYGFPELEDGRAMAAMNEALNCISTTRDSGRFSAVPRPSAPQAVQGHGTRSGVRLQS